MTDRFRRANFPTTELAGHLDDGDRHLDDRDRGVMKALANAGAFVAPTGGHLESACVGVPGAR